MAKYIAKAQRDENGDITGYRVGARCSTNYCSSKDHAILSGVVTNYPKAIQEGDNWVVVEDNGKKTADENRLTRKADARERLRSPNWGQATTVTKLKDIVKDLWEQVMKDE